MATNAENITLTMQRLGSRSSPTLRTQVVIEMNKTIRELERGPTKPWFMESRLTGSLIANQDYIEQPAEFLQEVEEGVFRLYDPTSTQWKPLVKRDYDYIQRVSENCKPALPKAYALHGTRVYFGPTPDRAYQYRWEAMVRSSAVVDNAAESSNPWLVEFFDLVSLLTADKIARLHIRSQEIARDLAEPIAQARDHFWRECEARQQINRNYEQE